MPWRADADDRIEVELVANRRSFVFFKKFAVSLSIKTLKRDIKEKTNFSLYAVGTWPCIRCLLFCVYF